MLTAAVFIDNSGCGLTVSQRDSGEDFIDVLIFYYHFAVHYNRDKLKVIAAFQAGRKLVFDNDLAQ